MIQFVYIMVRVSDGAIKIGRAKCVATRRRQLEAQHSSEMHVEFISPPLGNAEEIEVALLKALQFSRLRENSRELFCCSKEAAIVELNKLINHSNHRHLLKIMKTSVPIARHKHTILKVLVEKLNTSVSTLLEEAIDDLYLKYKDRL